MPAWWGRRSNKSKEETHNQTSFFELNSKKTPINSDKNNDNSKNKRSPRSLEDVSSRRILSPKLKGNNSREFGSSGGGGSSGLSGCDSDGCERKVVCHPLPRPTNHGVVDQGHGVGLLASGSASVSSVSSSGSNSDDPPSLLDQLQSGVCSGRAKSPGPGSRGATAATSPIHPRMVGMSSESPTGRQEEGRSQGHPLPLPPSSPSSPPSMSNGRAGLFTEPTHNSLSKWKKGRLLGRGTFGHVYAGFNSRKSGFWCLVVIRWGGVVCVRWDDFVGRMGGVGEVGDQWLWVAVMVSVSGSLAGLLFYGWVFVFVLGVGEMVVPFPEDGVASATISLCHLVSNFASPVLFVQNYSAWIRDEGGHMCAIKEVRIVSDDQNSRESLKQLNQEINLLSQLSHPNIVRYYGSELAGDTLSVYLEYVSGGSIHKLLQEYGPFKEPVIQNYTRQILYGLAYLHSRTTVHRDIKGANILVDPTGEIKLADFGMAKHITSCNSVLSFKGSPYWMAPEVVMNKNGYNLAVDIWSLGCTILEMAMAKPPWSQYEGVAAIFKIGNSKDIPEIPEFLSNDAKSFLHLCLQRDPSDRPLASKLLEHPFVKDQSVGRGLNINNATNEATSSHLMEDASQDNPRSITSLPVSPSSSPLHRLAPTSKSCFLSPPHPSYAWPGQSSHNINDHSVSPTRRRAGYTLDPWIESTLFKQTPGGGSSNMRLL
ncbi:Mitogen-activated protein kinase kinase kinase 3 [Bienertia sinuspersici]